jgi:metal-responsive CopG/Arc/MetJ family transcriptional regulator
MNENMIPPGHKVIAAPSKSIQIRVKVNLLDRIENQARKEGRSRSNMIVRAIKYYLDASKNVKPEDIRKDNRKEIEMKYNLQQSMELTGAVNEAQFKEAFSGKTKEEVNQDLIYMFGIEGDDIEFAEEIVILVKEI